jgi:hypothetical protein
MREIVPGGMSTIGASGDRGGFAAIAPEFGNRNTPASIIGEIIHQLTAIEMPLHNHGGTTDVNNADHTHGGGGLFDRVISSPPFAGTSGSAISVVIGVDAGGTASTDGESNPHAHTFTTTSVGGNATHNNTPRMMVGTFYMRL